MPNIMNVLVIGGCWNSAVSGKYTTRKKPKTIQPAPASFVSIILLKYKLFLWELNL